MLSASHAAARTRHPQQQEEQQDVGLVEVVHEIRDVLHKLGVGPRDVLRNRDAAKAGLTGDEDDDTLIGSMAEEALILGPGRWRSRR